ncbi:MAG TPA: zinc ribbon domain-containing protein [Gemmatimonadales bacterium]
MAAELVAAVVIGLLAVGYLLAPLIWPPAAPARAPMGYAEFEETPRGQALLAIKEIEFDRATGKLSQHDYEELKLRYTARAVALLEAETAAAPTPGAAAVPASRVPTCPTCGPRPEPDALICSSCGRDLPAVVACASCGNRLPAGARFCDTCGSGVA